MNKILTKLTKLFEENTGVFVGGAVLAVGLLLLLILLVTYKGFMAGFTALTIGMVVVGFILVVSYL